MPALATWSPVDPLLGVIAPLALGASVSTALVVDLDPVGPPLPGSATLADLVAREPTRQELSPSRRGTAVLGNGGIEADSCRQVLDALVAGWPHVVFRVRDHIRDLAPVVPVLPLLPAEIVGDHGQAVYQRVAWSGPVPDGSLTMPRPSAASISALLDQRRPVRGPWLRRWRRVWEASWA